jgi:hypothetical protein
VLGRRLDRVVLIDASIKHICLRIAWRPSIGWCHFYLIEVVVSIMIALGPSLMQAVHVGALHLDLIFTISTQFHFIGIVLKWLLKHGSSLLGACLLLLWLNVYV